MNWLHYLLAAAIVIVCMLLVIIILLQKGRGGGLSGAFGGGGGSGSAFGAKTGDVFTWITVAFVCLYFLLNIAGNYKFRQVVAIVPAGISSPETQTESDGSPGEDGDAAPSAADEGQPAQPTGEVVPIEIQFPVSEGDDEAATPPDNGDSKDAAEPDAVAEEPADPPAEEENDDPADSDSPDSPRPKPDSP